MSMAAAAYARPSSAVGVSGEPASAGERVATGIQGREAPDAEAADRSGVEHELVRMDHALDLTGRARAGEATGVEPDAQNIVRTLTPGAAEEVEIRTKTEIATRAGAARTRSAEQRPDNVARAASAPASGRGGA
jgi:hypothetical protein